MPEYTPSQKQAIEEQGRSLVVSAGAGSGKTTVLTRRIISRIENGGDIDDILVVTFTKSAAADMKEKLYNALSEAAAMKIENRRLADMCLKISSARISTISSFCFGFVRENFEVLGLSPKLRIADDAETLAIMNDCLADVEEKAFEADDGNMKLIADELCGEKSFKRLDSVLIELYNKFRASPFWKQRLRDAVSERENERRQINEGGFFNSKTGRQILSDTLARLEKLKKRALKLLEYAEGVAASDKNLASLIKLADDISALCEQDGLGYASLAESVNSFSAVRFYGVGIERDAVEYITREKRNITEAMNRIKDIFAFGEDMINSDWEREIALNRALMSILFAFDDAYTAAKNRRGICDYSDVEHLTLKLLGKRTPNGVVRTDLCKRYAESIKEIYVDEYQDVNPLQDMIFSLLSNGRNSFYVGDVKQSIYRFRNASADIFGNRVKNASDIGSDGDTVRIFLRENFRSSPYIIDFVNTVFSKLYTVENTGYSYENEKLVAAAKDYPASVDVSIITDTDSDERDKCEATVAAARILSLVGRAKRGDGRVLGYGDFAVLLRSATGRVSEYEKVFKKHGIPFSTEASENFLELPEVMLAVSLLTVIDDPTDEIALAAALRSPIFKLDAEELRQIRSFRPDVPFYFAVSACAGEYVRKSRHRVYHCAVGVDTLSFSSHRRRLKRGERPDMATLEKCHSFIALATEFSDYVIELPSHKLIWKLYESTRLPEIVGCFSHGEERKNNLIKLYRLAVSYEAATYRGLSSFLEYLKLCGGNIEVEATEGGDCVKIMTFHKSKGLEFPVVIVCGTGSRFNINDIRLPYVVNGDGFVCFDLKGAGGMCTYQPLIKLAASSEEKQEMLREELRCLYVALTRAEEQLYVIGCFDGDADEVASKDFIELKSNMERIICALHGKRSKCFTVEWLMADALPSPEDLKLNELLCDNDGETVSWNDYGYSCYCGVPAKVAVSELHIGLFESDEYERSISRSAILRVPLFADGGITPSERGTATHMFMQFCSFESVEQIGVLNEAKRLVGLGLLGARDADAVRTAELERFFKSPLYFEMKSSPRLKREMRFTIAADSSVLGALSGETVLVQGVIDCFFENPDGSYTVVDYKTDRLGANGAEILKNRHKNQLSAYCRAVEEITGKRVGRAVLYSFALGEEVDINFASK